MIGSLIVSVLSQIMTINMAKSIMKMSGTKYVHEQ